METKVPLKDIITLFLKLGFIGFGGPAAHIAMMQHEVVEKRKWMSAQHFLDLLGATNLIPGPNSTEMAIHIGYTKGGWKGLLAAGLCFIMPAVLITGFLAVLYHKYGQLPAIQPFIYGIKPAVIAIIAAAVYPLAIKAVKSVFLGFTGIAVLAASLCGFNEIALMFGAGFMALIFYFIQNRKAGRLHNIFVPVSLMNLFPTIHSGLNTQLFWIFLKTGALLYGSGYVLFAFLDTELVATGLLSRKELIDAVAVGQFTPGPVFSSVTFIGYQINGLSGAILSTIAIFLPSFAFVALLIPLMRKIRNSETLSAFLDAVNVASVAVIAAVCCIMARETVTDWQTACIAMICTLTVFKFKKVNSAFIVLGGALLGFLLYSI